MSLNYYGQPIVEDYDGIHYPADVPAAAGLPSVCSCGWTRFKTGGQWIELSEHIEEMGEYGCLRVGGPA